METSHKLDEEPNTKVTIPFRKLAEDGSSIAYPLPFVPSQESEQENLMDVVRAKKPTRSNRKRADIQALFKEERVTVELCKSVWAYCLSTEVNFQLLAAYAHGAESFPFYFSIDSYYSEVLFCSVHEEKKTCFIFKYGCIVLWDFLKEEQISLIESLNNFLIEPLSSKMIEVDDMEFQHSDRGRIKADIIQLVSYDLFERLSYSYAFAQSVKLSVFESVVDSTIENTKSHPEKLAKTGIIKLNRQEICRKIGELFVNRFFINLQTDILDTPDIIWENDDFADHYERCRRYLEIPKRVSILNQRLDIIKDLFDMLNNELVIQHGYRLEWIIIVLICLEVIIDLVWNIFLRKFWV